MVFEKNYYGFFIIGTIETKKSPRLDSLGVTMFYTKVDSWICSFNFSYSSRFK